MYYQAQIWQKRRVFLALVALAVCLKGTVNVWKTLSYDPSDPHFICGYSGFRRLHEGMSVPVVKRILGQPMRIRHNAQARVLDPATIAHLKTQQARISVESWRVYRALYEADPRPTGVVGYQLKQSLDRLQKQQEQVTAALSVLIKEVWFYEVPGWHGSLEVSIDVFGKASPAGCGYG